MSRNSSPDISIFLEAINKQSPAELSSFLRQACGDDLQLRRKVEALVAAHRDAGSFLDRQAPELDHTVDVDQDAMDAGLATAFGSEAAVVVGSGGHSVLRSLSKKLSQTPHVVLHDSHEESREIVKPKSTEIPEEQGDDRYLLVGEIARGGMGAIIRGRDRDLGRDLAIKVLLDSHKDRPEVIERFIEEAQIGGQLQHPGIVPVYELGELSDERPFFSMKLVKGKTLAAILCERNDPSEDHPHLLGIFEQVCQTMAYAHSRGVIHRDLKPANIMVGAFGEVQVMDWGLSKVLNKGGIADEERSLDRHRDASLIKTRRSPRGAGPGEPGSQTQAGSVMGTLAYMPPEQARGEVDRLDERADVFGLGAILCEILTGLPPYVATDGTQMFYQVTEGGLDDCYRRLDTAKVEPELLSLAKRALASEKTERWRDAGALSDAVTRHSNGVQDRLKEAELARVDALARAEEEQRRRWLHFAVTALMLLVAIGTGAAAVVFHDLASSRAIARDDAVRQSKIANVMRTAGDSARVRLRAPARSASFADEAWRRAQELDDNSSVFPFIQQELLNSAAVLSGTPLLGHEHRIFAGAISANGRWLVTVSSDHTARVWDLTSTNPEFDTRVLTGHRSKLYDAVRCVVITPDSRRAITASVDQTIRLWDLESEDPSADSRELQGEEGHPALALSPNGRWLAAGAHRSNTVRLWNLEVGDRPGEPILLSEQTGGISSLSISPNGRWLAAGARGPGDAVIVWDLESADPASSARRLKGHSPTTTTSCTFTPDSRWLFSASEDATCRVWDLESERNTAFRTLEGHTGGLTSVATSNDGKWIATGSADKTVRLWRREGDQVTETPLVLVGHEDKITALDFSSNSNWLATSSLDCTTRIWNLRARDPSSSCTVLRGHDEAIYDITFSPRDDMLVSCSWDGTARLWDMGADGPIIDNLLHGHQGQITDVAFGPKMRCLASASRDGTIRLWDCRGSAPFRTYITLKGFHCGWPTIGLQFSPDGRWLAAPGSNGTVNVWDLSANAVSASRRILNGHSGQVWPLAISPDSQWLATGAFDGCVRIWSLSAAAPPIELVRDETLIKDVNFSLDGQWLVVSTTSGRVDVWKMATLLAGPHAKPTSSWNGYDAGGGINYARFSDDGRYLVAGQANGDVHVWNFPATDVDFPHSCEGNQSNVVDLTVSGDSRWVITASWDGHARVWELGAAGSAPLYDFQTGDAALTSVALSRNGKWLVVGSEDRTARLWDLTAKEPTKTGRVLRGHGGQVTCVAISHDNRWVVTGGGDHLVRIWDLDIDATLERAQRLGGVKVRRRALPR